MSVTVECGVDVRTFHGRADTCTIAVADATDKAQQYFIETTDHQHAAAVSTQLLKDGDDYHFIITVVRTLAV